MARRSSTETAADSSDQDLSFLSEKNIKLDPAAPKTAQLYSIIRDAIVSLDLKPGTPINEKAFCEHLNTSRTPFREAILRLNNEHLVTVVPNSGTNVSKIDLQDVFDGQFIREAIELKAIRNATLLKSSALERELEFNIFQQERYALDNDYDAFYRLDEEFHAIICAAGSSRRVWNVVHQVKAQLDRVRRLAFPAMPGNTHLGVVLGEHSAVFDAIHSGSPNKAADALNSHLLGVSRTIRKLLELHGEYFTEDSWKLLDSYDEHRRLIDQAKA